MNKLMNKLLSQKKTWIIAGAVLLVGIIGIAWKKNQKPNITYRHVTATRGNLQTSILSTGTVQPENRLEIKPPIAGRAEQVLIDEGQIVKEGQILIWMSSTERAALLDAARARGPQDLKRWQEFYKATPVLAPIDGTIILRSIEPGQTFTTQDAVLVMSDRLTIQAQVDETDIAQIHSPQTAEIVLDAYPSEKISAHVNKIAYDSKTVSNVTTYIVDVLPDKTPPFMRSGMTANVSFSIGSRENVLTLPNEALKSKDGHAYVMMDSSKKVPTEREVQTGLTDGKRSEITSGISEGDTILVPQLKIGGHANAGSNPFSPMSGKPKNH